jgi:hypothetical protein
MQERKFDRLVPEFFCALGKLYEKGVPVWGHLFHTIQYLLDIFAYFHQLGEFEDFKYGLDDLVSPLLEEFIRREDPKALRELMVELAHVRAFLKQELEFLKRELEFRTRQ